MRRSIPAIVVALAAFGAIVAGCGGAEEATPTPETVVGTVPEETTSGAADDLPALELTGDPAAGASVWEASGCGSCHVLSAADSGGTVGPNLDEVQPSYELAVERVTKGLGAMPAFGDALSAQEIADLAQFVADSTGG